MKHIVNLRVEKSPEGVYLATSDDMPGLVAQGCTIAETIEIARDIARGLVEAQAEDAVQIALASTDGKAHAQRVTECYF
jgi:predicted RNase H-like HicB family nuclease